MKCKTCEVEIDPKWKHATDNNQCPFCGGTIMDEQLRDLLGNLRVIIDSAGEFSEQVDDWLLSNYQLIKLDSPVLAQHIPDSLRQQFVKEGVDKVKKDLIGNTVISTNTEGEVEETQSTKLQSAERTTEFLERAQVVRKGESVSDKTQRMKSILAQIEEQPAQAGVTPEADIYEDLGEDDADYVPASVLNRAAQVINSGGINAGTPTGHDARDLMRLEQQVQKSKNTEFRFK